MRGSHPFWWAGKDWLLLPLPALWWPEKRMLLVADLHLGKVGHFRRHGLAVPQGGVHHELQRLAQAATALQALSVVYLGDLFHSTANQEWRLFLEYMHQLGTVNHYLVKGNHDILPSSFYDDPALFVFDGPLVEEDIVCTHFPLDTVPADQYNLAGHIHPAVQLRGGGRQGLRLPAFVAQQDQLVLPAYGHFTGSATVKITSAHQVFVVAEGQVIPKSGGPKTA